MNKVVMSPEARNDLIEIERYISENIGSLQAAKNIVYVDRIIYKRRDYINILFGNE